jgi:hypothetical protein
MGHGSAITRLCGISVVYKGRVVPKGLLVVRVDIAVVPRWIYRDVAAAATYKLAQDGIGRDAPSLHWRRPYGHRGPATTSSGNQH